MPRSLNTVSRPAILSMLENRLAKVRLAATEEA